MTRILIPVSIGELIDKLTVLEIKADRIKDPAKLEHIHRELADLRRAYKTSPRADIDIDAYRVELKSVNETLWEIEDYLRIKEDEGAFDEQFIELARSQYRTSDRRAQIKRLIDEAASSDLTEEKSYPSYSAM
jgi:hypothetical protein